MTLKIYLACVFAIVLCSNCSDAQNKEGDVSGDQFFIESDSLSEIPGNDLDLLDSINVTKQDSIILDKELLIEEIDTTEETDIEAIEKPIEIEYYKSERDDPNYIGTPCQIENGECIMHKHTAEIEKNPD